jgi:FkbH-like protein
VRQTLIGGCVLQFLEDTFVHVGLQRGFDVFLRHHWPSRPDGLETLVQSWDPQITIFQPTVQSMMSALWDFGAFEDHSERQRHLKLIKTALSTYIVDLAELLEPRLGLVHNFAPPAVSPFGHLDFRMPVNFRQIVAEINHHLDELVQQYSHLMLLDEERLTTQYGSSVLFDDLLFPFGHHGGKPDPLINIPHQLPLLSRALVHEYLNIYEIYHGINRIKCIAVDLDDVLWPGIVADEGFAWLDSDLTNRWIHLGIHQALQLMKSRGILLASCSKGTQEATFAVWQQAQHPMLLKPDDFVLHKINWEQKSVNILQICHTLDIAPEQVLFLDDNPTERSEVHQRLPGIRIPDIPVHEFRRFLLTASCCEVSHITREANERTITTKAVLARKSLAENASSESFLASLRVQLTIGRATVQELPRVAELFNRTNQFNTTMLRTTPTELADWLQDPKVAIFVVSVTDCFVDYGLVGACIIHTNTIKGLAISCRVIGLEIALPFLLTCLSESGCMQPGTCGLTVQTERNTPAQDIYLRAGFEEVRVGEYIVKNVSALVSLKDFPHQVKVGSPFDNTHQKRSNE